MRPISQTHPILQNIGGLLLLCVCAWFTALSFQINPNSMLWLIGFFMTVVLCRASFLQDDDSRVAFAYGVYLFTLVFYLLSVWTLHILIPLVDPVGVKHLAALWLRILGVGGVYLPVALLYFTNRFLRLRSRWLGWAEGVGWVIASVFWCLQLTGNFFTDLRWTGVKWVGAPGRVYSIFFLFVTTYVAIGNLIPLVVLFRTREPLQRRKVRYYIVGAIPLWLACWGHFLMSFGINIYPAGGLLYLVHVSILAYAVLKHRVYDVRLAIRRNIPYALVMMIFGILYGGLVLGLMFMDREILGRMGVFAATLFMLFAGFVFAPLVQSIQAFIDKAFFREAANRQTMLEQFSKETAATVDLDDNILSLCRILENTIHPRHIAVYLANDANDLVLYGRSDGRFQKGQWPDGDRLSAFIPTAALDSGEATPLELSDPKPQAGQRPLTISERGKSLAVPIVNRGSSVGCILLGPKRADNEYSEEDIRWTSLVASHCSVAISNARSFARSEHLRSLNSQMLEGLPTGVMLLDALGQIVSINATATEVCGIASIDSAVNVEALGLVQPELANLIETVRRDSHPRLNTELRLAGSKPRTALVTIRPIDQGGLRTLLLVCISDVTEFRDAQQKALRNEALARVGEMISSINHEINNILLPMRFQVSMLREPPSSPKFTKAVAVIPERVQALERFLADLKDLSRPIELRIQKVDTSILITSAWSDVLAFNPSAGSVEFAIKIGETADYCYADIQWFRQVVVNLMKNAVEAMKGVGAPRLFVTADKSGKIVDIKIGDNGCGIDEAGLHHLFEAFYSTKGSGGTGLGLCISKRIVELHGGTLSVKSEKGQGATFVVSLPVLESPMPAKRFDS